MTGKRLKQLGIKWDKLIVSTMTRAQETAKIIAEQISDDVKQRNCSLLEEGAPIVPEPPVGHWKPEPHVSSKKKNNNILYVRNIY